MSQANFNNVKISGISLVVPDYYHTSNINTCNGFYIAPNGVTNVDICEAAANDLIKNMNIDINTLDAVLLVNQYPDHLSPSSSHIIHKRLNLPTNCIVFDVYHGSSGYVYGLYVASTMVSSGSFKKIILLASDITTENNTNFDLNLCFSSAGSATLLEYDTNAKPSHYIFDTFSSKYKDMAIPAGAYRLPVTHEILDKTINDSKGNKWSLMQKVVDVGSVREYFCKNIPDLLNDLLKNSQQTIDTIDFFAFNQFNVDDILKLAQDLSINNSKYSIETFKNYGNQTVISSIFNALDTLDNKVSANNNKVCLISFGEGLSAALCIINLDNIYYSKVIKMKFENTIMPKDYTQYWLERMNNNK